MSSLTKHKSLNSNMNEKSFECNKCGAKFTLLSSLHMHQRRHIGLKLFSCMECKKKFYSTGDLNRHIRSHNGVKRFQCHECHMKYTRKSSLKNHIQKVHLTEISVAQKNLPLNRLLMPCNDCGKMIHPDSLRIHKRKHTGEKPYLCLRCVSTYCDASSIRQHMRFHLEEGQVFCRNCQAIFDSEKELNDHVDVMHDNKNHYQLYSSEEVLKMRGEKGQMKRSRHKGISQLPCLTDYSTIKSTIDQEVSDQKYKSNCDMKSSCMQLSDKHIKMELVDDEIENSIQSSFFHENFQELEIKHEDIDFEDEN